MPCAVLFYLNTGNGHYAPAKSLALQFEQKGYKAVLIDGLKGSPNYAKLIIEKGYKEAITRAIWVFELLYFLIYFKPLRELILYSVSRVSKPYIKKRLQEENPEKVIILHHFIIRPVKEAVEELGLDITPTIIVTDPFTAPRTWFKYKDLDYITFSDKVVKKRNINYKVKPFILNEKFFNSDINKDSAKELLGFCKDKKVVLFLGGGDGLPRGISTLKKLLKKKIDIQIIYISGRNMNQQKKAKVLESKYNNLTVTGFVSNIELYLKAADIAITKAGASTIYEMLSSCTIPIITRYIWKQEKGNKDYIVKNSLGFFEPTAKGVCNRVNKLIESPTLQNIIRENISKLTFSNGAKKVCEELMCLH